MYVVAWGCCWYICFPRVSPRSKHVCVRESVLHLAVDLGEPGKKTWGANQITDPFGKEPSTCCGGQAWCGQLRHISGSYLLPSPDARFHTFLKGSCCQLRWGRLSCIRPCWCSPREPGWRHSCWRTCRVFPADELGWSEAEVGLILPAAAGGSLLQM